MINAKVKALKAKLRMEPTEEEVSVDRAAESFDRMSAHLKTTPVKPMVTCEEDYSAPNPYAALLRAASSPPLLLYRGCPNP